MLKIIRRILSIIGIALAVYGLVTQNFQFMPYLISIVGLTILIVGAEEIKKNKKAYLGYLCIVVSIFAFYTAIQSFI